IALSSDNEPDAAGDHGQLHLAPRRKEALLCQCRLERLNACEKVSKANGTHLIAHHLEISTAHPPLGFRMNDHACAIGEIKTKGIELCRRESGLERHVLVGVAKSDKDQMLPPLDVEDLTLDPHRTHACDVFADLWAEVANGPGALG